MEQALKQRLTGAVALAALAVIFLPALLDGEGYRQAKDGWDGGPRAPGAQPDFSFEQDFGELGEGGSDSLIKRIERDIDIAPAPPPVVPPPRAAPAADAPPAAPPAPAPADAPGEDAAASAAWRIQLATFETEAKAADLTQRLNKGGHAAVYRRESGAEGEVYVVILDAAGDYEDAREIADEVERAYRVKTFIRKREDGG